MFHILNIFYTVPILVCYFRRICDMAAVLGNLGGNQLKSNIPIYNVITFCFLLLIIHNNVCV
jgi:hypothetical protein